MVVFNDCAAHAKGAKEIMKSGKDRDLCNQSLNTRPRGWL